MIDHPLFHNSLSDENNDDAVGKAAADDLVDRRPGPAAAGKEKVGEKLPVVYEEDMPVRFVYIFVSSYLFLFLFFYEEDMLVPHRQ